jgi:hypothetical protein
MLYGSLPGIMEWSDYFTPLKFNCLTFLISESNNVILRERPESTVLIEKPAEVQK